jgi:chromosome segregation ATPase
MTAMNQKIMLLESKRRYMEQVSRDPNNQAEMLSPMEIEELKKEIARQKIAIAELTDELQKRNLANDKVVTELATAQYNLATAERNCAKVEARLEDMIKKESFFQERLNEAGRQAEQRLKEQQDEFEKERAESHTKTQQIEFLVSKKIEMEKAVARLDKEKDALKLNIDSLENTNSSLKVRNTTRDRILCRYIIISVICCTGRNRSAEKSHQD